MQHKPRFSGIIIAAVLMVAALVMISSYSSLFAPSKSTMMLSEAMGYFESNQVTYFNLDLNTGVIPPLIRITVFCLCTIYLIRLNGYKYVTVHSILSNTNTNSYI